MKFIHAADLHLGAPFADIGGLPKELLATVLSAQETALGRLVDDALTENVDWVMLVGDIFDQPRPDIHEILVFIDQMKRLAEAQIPVYLTRGNHDFDWLSQVAMALPSNVTIFPAQVTTEYLTTKENERVALTGFSYDQAHLTQGQVVNFPKRPQQVDWALGLYHGEQGQQGDYAPFDLQAMLAKHYDYWALGHIHQRTTLHQDPFIGYAGDMQATKSNEVADKGYYLVTANGTKLTPHFTGIAPVAFKKLTVQADSEQALLTQLRAVASNEYDLTLVSVQVRTQNPLLAEKIMLRQVDPNANWPTATSTWVINLDLLTEPTKQELPVVPAKYWAKTAAQVFNYDSLQALGLNQIHDADLLDQILAPDYLLTLEKRVKDRLEILERGGMDAD